MADSSKALRPSKLFRLSISKILWVTTDNLSSLAGTIAAGEKEVIESSWHWLDARIHSYRIYRFAGFLFLVFAFPIVYVP